eukprot:scaffold260_cov328-Prasinococcus_capsulatus_cf.AAC.4
MTYTCGCRGERGGACGSSHTPRQRGGERQCVARARESGACAPSPGATASGTPHRWPAPPVPRSCSPPACLAPPPGAALSFSAGHVPNVKVSGAGWTTQLT